MPLLESSFRPPWYLRNAHLQTILAALLPRPQIASQREPLRLRDGDEVDLDWMRWGNSRLAVLSHGLEGSSGAGYIRGLAACLRREGWDVLAWNYRGCSGRPNRLLRTYHSGESGDLREVIAHAARGYKAIALIGFSLGGNITLKYLGEAPPHPKVKAAVAFSTPVDLTSSAVALDSRWDNRIYLRRFLKSLIEKVETKAQFFPGELNVTGARQLRNFRDFDNRFTAPMHGFTNSTDYWSRASSRPLLSAISVPTLLVNAKDDSFLGEACYPVAEARRSTFLHLETPAQGGHLGFMDRLSHPCRWHERRALEFLGDHVT